MSRWQYLDSVEPILPPGGQRLSWLPEMPAPVRRAGLPTALLVAVSFFVPVVTQAVPSFDWHSPLSEPTRTPASLRLDASAAEPVLPSPPPVAQWYPMLPAGSFRGPQPLAPRLPAGILVDASVPVVLTGAFRDKFTIGTKESLSVTGDPVIGGPWSW